MEDLVGLGYRMMEYWGQAGLTNKEVSSYVTRKASISAKRGEAGIWDDRLGGVRLR